jgi:hypothetical protein
MNNGRHAPVRERPPETTGRSEEQGHVSVPDMLINDVSAQARWPDQEAACMSVKAQQAGNPAMMILTGASVAAMRIAADAALSDSDPATSRSISLRKTGQLAENRTSPSCTGQIRENDPCNPRSMTPLP